VIIFDNNHGIITMAEVAGLALGVPGVINVLIKTCQEGYVFINKACDADKDFEDYKHQFSVEEQKLKDITTIVATRIQDLRYKIEEKRFCLIAKTLLRIAQLFSDFSQLERVYGVHTSFSDEATVKPSKRSRIRKVFGLKASKKHTTGNNEHDGSKIGSALTDLELDEKLQIATLETLETLEPRLRSAIHIFPRLKWAFSDYEKAQTLISKLREYSSNMKDLVDGHSSTYLH
jgi:hypothetical protein